ncbi:hypothetical protein NEHOM01_1141 [Nematocida homosporus]|uniref:uncharacterized protein n=1 Tax=Nematocida homosporus TaxID=1912981 RepID=UPI00221ED499|nr:uncharacterized protein NEHOM01_1141 [Nematocida homosporus]KAI5185891.1 hypothetical protein NEHOM01_1141 [Nematocida homosporus]
MESVVLIFSESVIHLLDGLLHQASGALYRLRVFPLLVADGRIMRRWVAVQTEGAREFQEKEEKSEDVHSFVHNMRKRPCMIFIDMPGSVEDLPYFVISTTSKQLEFQVGGQTIGTWSIKDVYEGIVTSVLSYFHRTQVQLTGIRIKNKEGKKKTVETDIYLEGIDMTIPSQMEIVHNEAKGILISKNSVYTENRLFIKMISGNTLAFTGQGIFLKLEAHNNKIIGSIIKPSTELTILDGILPGVSKYYAEKFKNSLVRSVGPEIEGILDGLIGGKEEGRPLVFENEIQKIKALTGDKKNKIMSAVLEILNTLTIPNTDKKHNYYQQLKKMYLEERVSPNIETKKPAVQMHLRPSTPVGPRSLCQAIWEMNSDRPTD